MRNIVHFKLENRVSLVPLEDGLDVCNVDDGIVVPIEDWNNEAMC